MPNKTLNPAIDGDILELAVMRRMYEMAKKEEYLKQHRFKVYQGKDGRWFTYVPDPRKETGRRQVVRHSTRSASRSHYEGLELVELRQ